MAGVCVLLRRTIRTVLRDYHHLAVAAALLAFPASAVILLSQAIALSPPPLLQAIQDRLASLLEAAGFPPTAELPAILHQKLSQALFSAACTFPLAPTFLVLAKAYVVRVVIFRRADNRMGGYFHALSSPPLPHLQSLYLPMLRAHLCSTTAIVLANVVVIAVLLVLFNAAGMLGLVSSTAHLLLSAAGAVLYSIALAHVLVACNLAVVVAGAETRGGAPTNSFLSPMAKAYSAMKLGGAATVLSLALPANIGLAAVEALFQYRVVRPYSSSGRTSLPGFGSAAEAVVIAYMHALFVVVDVVASCVFYKDCGPIFVAAQEGDYDSKPDRRQREGIAWSDIRRVDV